MSGPAEDQRLETLDASLAANIIQVRLDNLESELKELDGIKSSSEEALSRINWCQTMRHKLREALVRLYSMLSEYSRAVKLSMQTNMTQEAIQLANRVPNQLQRKQIWMMIAHELLVVQMSGLHDATSKSFKTQLRSALAILLTQQDSCLTIEDILPILPPQTKMQEIKEFLSTRVRDKMKNINKLKENIESQSKEIEKLQESKKKKAKSHILVNPDQKCDLCS